MNSLKARQTCSFFRQTCKTTCSMLSIEKGHSFGLALVLFWCCFGFALASSKGRIWSFWFWIVFGLVLESNLVLAPIWIWTGMAYQLNLADNRLPIFDQSRLPITDILSVPGFTDTDNRYSKNSRYIGVLPIYRGKITQI